MKKGIMKTAATIPVAALGIVQLNAQNKDTLSHESNKLVPHINLTVAADLKRYAASDIFNSVDWDLGVGNTFFYTDFKGRYASETGTGFRNLSTGFNVTGKGDIRVGPQVSMLVDPKIEKNEPGFLPPRVSEKLEIGGGGRFSYYTNFSDGKVQFIVPLFNNFDELLLYVENTFKSKYADFEIFGKTRNFNQYYGGFSVAGKFFEDINPFLRCAVQKYAGTDVYMVEAGIRIFPE